MCVLAPAAQTAGKRNAAAGANVEKCFEKAHF
jgi:hypothetical protein